MDAEDPHRTPIRNGSTHHAGSTTSPPLRSPFLSAPASGSFVQPQLRRRTAAMPVTLALVLGAFTLFAVISVVLIGAWSGYRNTVDLMRQKADVVVNSALAKLDLHLGAAENQTAFLAEAIINNEVTPDGSDRFVTMIQGALAATPQISALYFLDHTYHLTGAERTADSAVPVFAGLGLDPDIRRMVAQAQERHSPYWAPLLWRDEWQSLQVNLRYPVWRGETFLGVMVANISVPSLSEFMADMESDFGFNAFILVDRQRVLAHPMLQFGMPNLSRWHPMPSLAEVGDPVLMSIWDESLYEASLNTLFSPGQGHAVRIGNETYLFLYRALDRYGGAPWLVGSYLRASDLSAEFQRLITAIALCGGILVLVVIGSVWMGRRISRPAQILAREARLVRTLDFDAVRPVPGSYFRELNDAAQAFNAMLVGLRWFQAYVPKTLVRRLIAAGLAGETSGQVRHVTVMFTDIADFTGLSADLSPAETAVFLNQHFTLITDCVLAEGGTIDKFIGDSVMAFWGAPDDHPDHAARALRAARAIALAIAEDNAQKARMDQNRKPVYIRIGLHSGPAVVGNIGSEERLNYTLVGQTVILAHRLEQFGRALPRSSRGAATVLATTSCLHHCNGADAEVPIEHIGTHRLRGSTTPIDIVRIQP